MKSILFGIDKQFFQTISKQERNKYNTILVFFLLLININLALNQFLIDFGQLNIDKKPDQWILFF